MDSKVKRPTVDDVRDSLAFRNLTVALNQVFGGSWKINVIFPGTFAKNFDMWLDISGVVKAAYINVVNTHMSGMYSSGPGGRVGVSVPFVSENPIFTYTDPDGRIVRRPVSRVCTDDELKSEADWRAEGANAKRVLAFKSNDGIRIVGVDELIGTDEEKESYPTGGATGADVEDIVGLLNILRRYLEQVYSLRWPESSGA